MTDTEVEWLRVGQADRRLGVSTQTIRNGCDDGRIAFIRLKPRGDRRIPSTELDRLRAEAERNRASLAAEAAVRAELLPGPRPEADG